MEEIEAKFLNINPVELEHKLASIGAQKVGEYFYRRRVFDYPDWRLNAKGAWLRLRDEGEKVTLSLKQRIGMGASAADNDEGMEETEIIVNDFDITADLLLKLGFVEKHYMENKRIRWTKEEVEFDIDFYPALEPYLEIEASSWGKVDEAIEWLGLNPAEKRICGAGQVFKLNGIRVNDYTRITFDGLIKRDEHDQNS